MGLPTPMELTRTYRGLKEGTAARRARDPEKPKWGTTILFLAPTSLLLLIFLIYPAIYTVLLSFNRGRNGTFNEWVGLDNYARLFADQDFLNLSTFPPSGALWNNVLWLVLYVSIVIFFGLILAQIALRRSAGHGVRPSVTDTEDTTQTAVGNKEWHIADVTEHTAPRILHGSGDAGKAPAREWP